MGGALGPVLGGAAALGGLAYTLGKGESPLPSQFGTLTNQIAPQEYATGKTLTDTGQALAASASPLLATGTTGFQMAEQGVLTPEQQAQLTAARNTETSQAVQMYESMGRNPTKDTSFLSTGMTIDANMMQMAQSFIQTTLDIASKAFAAGGTLLSAGASMVGEGLGFENAAVSALTVSGNAQLKNDEDYSNAVAQAFGNVAKAFAGGGGGSNKNSNSPDPITAVSSGFGTTWP